MYSALRILLIVCLLVFAVGPKVAGAEPSWLGEFIGEYPSATRLHTCGVCHTNFSQESSKNAYGKAFEEADGEDNALSAMRAIEGDDSDRDGTSNLAEIMAENGFMPGYTCANYANTTNAPANLAFYVDPLDVGCGNTTSTTVTTTMPTTTTTLVVVENCAQPLSSGTTPTASDCLYILNAAVGALTCSPECICAPKGSLPVSATDALLCLSKVTGIDVALECPCSMTSTTSTTTSTMGGGNVAAGQMLYDLQCAGCHKAGAHDSNGAFSDLAGKGGLVVQDLGTLYALMDGLLLSEQEVLDLAAFLDSL